MYTVLTKYLNTKYKSYVLKKNIPNMKILKVLYNNSK